MTPHMIFFSYIGKVRILEYKVSSTNLEFRPWYVLEYSILFPSFPCTLVFSELLFRLNNNPENTGVQNNLVCFGIVDNALEYTLEYSGLYNRNFYSLFYNKQRAIFPSLIS